MEAPQQHALTQRARQRYLEENIQGLNPVQLLIKVYEAAIQSCVQNDRARLSRCLVELIASLNFEQRDVAVPLFRLYNYCLREGKRGNFEVVKNIMTELRDSWQQTEQSPAAT